MASNNSLKTKHTAKVLSQVVLKIDNQAQPFLLLAGLKIYRSLSTGTKV
jgi:hypothetical protein